MITKTYKNIKINHDKFTEFIKKLYDDYQELSIFMDEIFNENKNIDDKIIIRSSLLKNNFNINLQNCETSLKYEELIC